MTNFEVKWRNVNSKKLELDKEIICVSISLAFNDFKLCVDPFKIVCGPPYSSPIFSSIPSSFSVLTLL